MRLCPLDRRGRILIAAALALVATAALSAAPAAGGAAGSAAESARPDDRSSLVLGPGDLRIEQLADGGYHLYVRAKKGVGSVLLTESTQDPSGKVDSFAYRALEKNSVNGDEKRVLDGKVLSSKTPLYFLLDSSPEQDSAFGSAFHIFIPWVVAWGYPWSRSGQVFIHDGSFINVRAFAKTCADYSGSFADNPFTVRVSQARKAEAATPESSDSQAKADPAAATEPSTSSAIAARTEPSPSAAVAAPAPAAFISQPPLNRKLYVPETLAAFKSIAADCRGESAYASGPEDVPRRIDTLLARHSGRSLDLVLCIDSTDTMGPALAALRSGLPPLLAARLKDFPSYRLGIVSYKDYFEEYLCKRFDFTSDQEAFASELEALHSGGGRDLPEAAYEGLFASANEFPWLAQDRLIILVGDAPPHPLPRGSIAKADVEDLASALSIEIDTVAVPK